MTMAIHDHCMSCYDAHCHVDISNQNDGEACEVIHCPSGCNIRLHECKVSEHQSQLCAAHMTLCINSSYGCPLQFPRAKLMAHLRHCPASVVTCKAEWSRYLRTPKGKTTNLISSLSSTHSSDVLNVAFAARDQGVLEESFQLPRQLRRSLHSTFNRNFPAVPFIQRTSSVSIDESTTEGSTDSLDNFFAFEEEEDPRRSIPGFSASSPRVHCSLCKKKEEQGLASSISKALSQINAESHRKNIRTSNYWINCADPTDKINELTGGLRWKGGPLDIEVDLLIEMYSSYIPKPEKVLTFLCAQDFRRDQFYQHYSTVHSGIQSELDSWFQIRCPLACYGCQYTQQRFVSDKNDKVVFNPVTRSFCLKPAQEYVQSEGSDIDRLSSLPDEVLLLIFTYMDSLSLKNLSLTSKILREKCSYILETHGIVILDWRKGDGAWTIFEKVWSFSNAFEQVNRWKFAELPSMAEHLQSCTYNERSETKASDDPSCRVIV